jgi:hypothetical protein
MKNSISVLLLLFGLNTFGATYCVGPSATGNGSGTNWNNLKSWTSGQPARGDVWYLVNGSYASHTLNTTASGTTLCTIKKATASNYTEASATGWNSAYAAQASIANLVIGSSYWLIDGITGAGASTAPADTATANYGFYLTDSTHVVTLSGTITDVTIRHTRFYTTGLGANAIYDGGTSGQNKTNVTASYCLFDGFNEVMRNDGDAWYSPVLEYSIILNSEGDTSNHGNAINAMWQPLWNIKIRYNVFKGFAVSTALTGVICGNNANFEGGLIYGNVFDTIAGSYLVGANSGYSIDNCTFYNNTVINSPNNSNPVLGRDTGSGNVAANNLYYNGSWSAPYGGAWTGDYDAWFSCSTSVGSHAYVSTGSPFVDYANMDYRLKAQTPAGTPLGSTYMQDALGAVRTTWSRGALEYAGVATTNASIAVSPGSLNFGTVAVNSTNNLTFTVLNAGGGTLAGTATVAGPFSVVTGGTYSLGANQSQTVTVRFVPSAAASYSSNMTFTGGGGYIASVSGSATNSGPQVSAISSSGADVDPITPGLQVYAGSVIQYSGTASDPKGASLTWQWIYTVNGGAETVVQSGSGTVGSISFAYPPTAMGNTYVWKLRVSNGSATTESDLTVGVEAAPAPQGNLTFQAGSATITAPFVVANGVLYQSTTVNDAVSGGSATYSFSLTNGGSFVIQALVSATNLANNSFYVNIDGAPQDPSMAWDIMPITSGFEQRMVSWRGNGTSEANQFVPEIFQLSAGTHQIVIKGREAYTQLQSFSILQVPPPPLNLHVLAGP